MNTRASLLLTLVLGLILMGYFIAKALIVILMLFKSTKTIYYHSINLTFVFMIQLSYTKCKKRGVNHS